MTKLERTISLLKLGYATSLDCALQGGVMSLSQRVGELRYKRVWYGSKTVRRFDIAEKWVKTAGGARVKAWMITKDRESK